MGQRPGHQPISSSFADRILGRTTRSCYDLVDGLIRMMETGSEFPGPVNLGNPSEFTIRQLAEEVLRLVGGGSRLMTKPLPADDPRQRRPDISLARTKLGWEPTIPLADGLTRTIDYFKRFAS